MPPARLGLYAFTTIALIVLVRSLLGHPPGLVLAVGILVAYLAYVLAGVFVLSLRMWVDAVCRGPAGSRGVALTFDDGPHPTWTPRILDELDRHRASATFFVVGKKAEVHPELVREIRRRGHTIGIHGHAHDRFFALRSAARIRADLVLAKALLEGILGEEVRWFRPPIGHTNPTIGRVADELDLVTVGWSARGFDGLRPADVDGVAARIQRDLRDGAIVLLHDSRETGDEAPASIEVLPRVLAHAHASRLEIVPLRDWVDDVSRS
ncbi:MAG: polysaccharide deacetylase family protein [Polyangiaceae bacterium]